MHTFFSFLLVIWFGVLMTPFSIVCSVLLSILPLVTGLIEGGLIDVWWACHCGLGGVDGRVTWLQVGKIGMETSKTRFSYKWEHLKLRIGISGNR